ncbi:MAG: carboxypeptidase regulatory-like domain-containing protein, partial [Lewinella sp.]
MTKVLFTLLLFVTIVTTTFAQIPTDCISGRVVDQETGEPLPFATVQFFRKDKFLQGGSADLDGNFLVCGLPKKKTVDVQIDYTGYATVKITGLSVGKHVGDLVVENTGGVSLDLITVIGFKVPLIEQDNTTSGQTVTSEQVRNLPTRNINQRKARTAGTASAKEKKQISIRGSRSNTTDYYIDGVRVRATSIPGKPSPEPEVSEQY